MGDGYAADPELLRAYAHQVEVMCGGIGEGRDAANQIMTTNAVDIGKDDTREALLGKLGLHDSGRLDRAYGVICQPWGMMLEDFQQNVTDGIGHVMSLMSMLADGLKDTARQYTVDDLHGKSVFTDVAADHDSGSIPVPNGDTAVTVPRASRPDLPRIPRIPRIPEVRGE